ncbi:hypothetical protein [Thalassotalea euphylliae]|uniref:Uncharacterized protein n=1 Tax=Thalassotalea euphylliae TaxID=1655234 RepID=A0A3E0UJ22_9GAMM|nr:hypothetical protein [Thalassotalea euphylliae]REL36623.1 hypothetical protein DXX92_15590 [Thalassotalea euphylliae]
MLRALVFLLPIALLGCGSTSDTNQSSTYSAPANVVVLNYYPNCPYHVLGEVSGFSGISASEHQQLKSYPRNAKISSKLAKNSVDEAILQLKQRAEKLGADAIAITDYQTTQIRIRTQENRTIKAKRHRMTAEAIVLCQDKETLAKATGGKITNFNAKGESNIALLKSGAITTAALALTDSTLNDSTFTDSKSTIAPTLNSATKVVAEQAADTVVATQAKRQKTPKQLTSQRLTPRRAIPRRSSTTEQSLADIANVERVASTASTKSQGNAQAASINAVTSTSQFNENIDVNGDILGAQLGWNKRQVTALLGEPSAIIKVSGKQSAFLYGRKHLFLFDRDTFVGYEHSDWLLPLHLSNRIPLHDNLYGADITIDKELEIGSTLLQVSKALYLKAPILRFNTLRVQGRKTLTRLYFNGNTSADKANNKQLSGISIYFRGYQEFDWQGVVALASSTTFIDLTEGLLESKRKISKDDVVDTLGLPTITIPKARNKDVWVYGNSLIVDFVRGNMIKYTLESNKYQSQRRPCVQCLYVGQPRTEIPNRFVTQRTQNQLTLENNGFSYLVNLSEDSTPKVDEVQVFIKQ